VNGFIYTLKVPFKVCGERIKHSKEEKAASMYLILICFPFTNILFVGDQTTRRGEHGNSLI
jgi:hypothetical protein